MVESRNRTTLETSENIGFNVSFRTIGDFGSNTGGFVRTVDWLQAIVSPHSARKQRQCQRSRFAGTRLLDARFVESHICWKRGDEAMNSVIKRLVATGFAAALAMLGVCMAAAPSAQASEIKYVVNNTAITTYDIQKRAAFLKLQRKPGASAKMAADDMVDQVLKSQEMELRKIKIAKATVDASFAKFAASNKMSVKQLSGVLDQAGVTAAALQGIHPRPDGLGAAAVGALPRRRRPERAGRRAAHAPAGRRQADRHRIYAAAGDLRRAGERARGHARQAQARGRSDAPALLRAARRRGNSSRA